MKVVDIRKKTGLSQAKFAAQYGIPRRTVEDWERGVRVPPEYVVAWLERLVNIDYPDLQKSEQ